MEKSHEMAKLLQVEGKTRRDWPQLAQRHQKVEALEGKKGLHQATEEVQRAQPSQKDVLETLRVEKRSRAKMETLMSSCL